MEAKYDMPEMVMIPPGEFVMGGEVEDRFSNDTERPGHRVCIRKAFALSKYPITNAQYRSYFSNWEAGEDEMLPVVRVSWDDAIGYCEWLSKVKGKQYRLPSEAEWEYACRSGTTTPFHTGDDITVSDANFLYSEDGRAIGAGSRTRVGVYTLNAFGIGDMHGNVCEWVADCWHPTYYGAPTDGAAWCEQGEALRRVIRGGAWDYLPRLLRSAWRDAFRYDQRRDNLGFRVALDCAEEC